MSLTTTVSEGVADYHVPTAGKPCKTWYKVFGDLSHPGHERPLVVVHGGPGSCHNYLLPISKLWDTHHIPVVLYDQIGNGNSTHLPEKKGDVSFWTEVLFRDELENLLRHLKINNDYDLLGQSWGGMLSAAFATYQPKGLKRLIITNSPASMDLWVESSNKLRLTLPEEVQAVLDEHEEAGTTDSEAYEEATQVFYKRHLCRVDPWPEELAKSFEIMGQDSTVYLTMNGPNEFYITGSLKTWSIIDDLHKVKVPTLVINGRYDGAQDEAVFPFFNNIPKCRWVRFEGSSHLPQFEEPERFFELIGDFLTHARVEEEYGSV
ncbi:hypothetical protein Clacol_000844 [Clathrus columnatus]|uniref:AB hydrolase-1 domain-containing protein n=1 Tax=Clathrus columnatus TaxID=1419009 RepID=A0AAV5A0V1_9AGAM|nr:hypothetical protein Clacol_000844 [Clathrus columnatus]